MDQDRALTAPLVVFSSRPNSHPFQERHISIQDPIKIGRSVARAHPAPTNAIFDCKVLSRNHALLWFEDNKFYLQDTKSSNGTFVNNQRLSKGSEESDPHEIFSGDIIQFGVDVMENSKRVTHGCIMASVTLYLPDGSEARPRFSSRSQTASHSISSIHSQEMYQLSQYLQEASHREQILQDKMSQLQTLLNDTSEACDVSWHALINEDRLLSKLEVLQNQLAVYGKNQTEGHLQQQIVSLEEERLNRETSSKQSLRKVLEEKIQTIQELADVKRTLADSDGECKHLRNMHDENQQLVIELSEKYDSKLVELDDLAHRLEDTERSQQSELATLVKEKDILQEKLDEALLERETLQAKVNFLLNQSDQGSAGSGDADDGQVKVNGEFESVEGVDSDEETESVQQKLLMESLQTQLDQANETIAGYQSQLDEVEPDLRSKEEELRLLRQQLENTQLNMVEYVTKVATLEQQLKSTVSRPGPREDDSYDANDKSNELDSTITIASDETDTAADSGVRSSMDEISELKEKLATFKNANEEMRSQMQQMQDELNSERQLRDQSQQRVNDLKDELIGAKEEVESQAHIAREYKEKMLELEQKLSRIADEHLAELTKRETDNNHLTDKVTTNQKECETLRNECNLLRTRIQTVEADLQRLQQDNTQLDVEIKQTKAHNRTLDSEIEELKESCQGLKQLKESLENQKDSMRENLTDTQKEAQQYKDQLAAEGQEKEALLSAYNQSLDELKVAQQKLEEAEKSRSEMQERLKSLTDELARTTKRCERFAEKSSSVLPTWCTSLPVAVLVVAIVIVMYPFLSRITATSDHPL